MFQIQIISSFISFIFHPSFNIQKQIRRNFLSPKTLVRRQFGRRDNVESEIAHYYC